MESPSFTTWPQIMISLPMWFFLKVAAKKRYKWSLVTSLAFTGFIPLVTFVSLTLGVLFFWCVFLVAVQCGLLTMATASVITFMAILIPTALAITCFIYVTYKCTLFVLSVIRWVFALPEQIWTMIAQEFHLFCATVQGILGQQCFWRLFRRKSKKEITAEVRTRAERRITEQNSQQLSDSDVPQPLRTNFRRGHRQNQQGFMGYLDTLQRTLQHESEVEKRRTNEKRKRTKGWLSWVWSGNDNNSIPDRDMFQGSRRSGFGGRRNWRRDRAEFECTRCLPHSTELSSTSEGEVGILSGRGTDSFHTADEWFLEDGLGNIVPDYRDSELKMYELLLKRDLNQSYY